MKTSSADVRSRAAKRYFYLLPVTLLAAALASVTEIEPRFEAGGMTKRPVAALRPSTAFPCLPGLLLTVSERVAMTFNVRISGPARKRRFATCDGAEINRTQLPEPWSYTKPMPCTTPAWRPLPTVGLPSTTPGSGRSFKEPDGSQQQPPEWPQVVASSRSAF